MRHEYTCRSNLHKLGHVSLVPMYLVQSRDTCRLFLHSMYTYMVTTFVAEFFTFKVGTYYLGTNNSTLTQLR